MELNMVMAVVTIGAVADLIDIAVMAGIERIKLADVERYRIPPPYACAWATVDADIQSRGDGQFRKPDAVEREPEAVAGDDRRSSRRSECRDLDPRRRRRRHTVSDPADQ